jgi:uncharacterized protein (DUF2062 family)
VPLSVLKKLSPRRKSLADRWFLRPFGAVIHDPALWLLDRHGAARALALGLFVCWLPLPVHMPVAALIALMIRVHLPLAVVTVWISNPLTMLPMYYAAQYVGHLLLGDDGVWVPLALGYLTLGTISATIGYFLFDLLWHWTLVRKYHRIRDAGRRRASRELQRTDPV